MSASRERTNILLIMTDQHRWDTLGCYGQTACRTPHLDGLAERGVRFDAAYTPTSPCSPARAAIFTGLYPHQNGVLENDDPVNPAAPTMASELGRAGYNLGYVGKWHVDRDKVPSDYGFRGKDFPGYGYPPTQGLVEGLRFMNRIKPAPHYAEYLRERGLEPPKVLEAYYGANPGQPGHEVHALQSGAIEQSFEAMVSAQTIDLLREFAQEREQTDKPFFLWANFWGPHTPILIPEPYWSMYDPASIPEEPSFSETWERKPGVQELFERFWGMRDWGWEGWREAIARYWGYVTMIDDLVGRILAALRELGLEENTLVVFTTDHGDMIGAHRLIEKGPFTYEESYRLPFVAAHPDCRTPGATSDEFVYSFDLLPTFCEVAGLEPPQSLAGSSASILPTMLDAATSTGRDSIYTSFESQVFHAPNRMVRTRRWKFVYNPSDIGELYDLAQDPHELRNLIDLPETRQVQRELMALMRQHMVRVGDPILGRFDRIRHVY
jgi:arylsulfatase A-like enzyme